MMSDKNYTAQVNNFANVIVCGDEVERVSYTIVFTGSYKECLEYKEVGKIVRKYRRIPEEEESLENNL